MQKYSEDWIKFTLCYGQELNSLAPAPAFETHTLTTGPAVALKNLFNSKLTYKEFDKQNFQN